VVKDEGAAASAACRGRGLLFRKMRSSAMMKGGRRAVFCYGQRVWSRRIDFRRALTLPVVEATAV
jgi:hypothetical protein